MKNRELNILDYLAVLVKWRKLIFINMVAVFCTAVVVSLILPKWYRAQTTLMPPIEQQSAFLGLASVISELPIGELGVPGMRTSYEIFQAILESRTVAEAIVKKADLTAEYRKKKVEDAILTLWDHSQIEITEVGMICISVEERDPELAARLANLYVQELDRVNQMASISEAKNTRIFVEGRLEETESDLKAAEEALRLFQEKNKTISLPEQIAAAIENAAELRAKQVGLEIEKGVLLKSLGAAHPQVLRLQSEIAEIQKQLDQITLRFDKQEPSQEANQNLAWESFNIPLLEVPSVGLQLARLTREVKIQEAIYELLIQQYEKAKIQEARDTPTVQVLDKAVPPIRKSRPKRMLFVLVWSAIGVFLGVSCSFSLDYWQRIKSERNKDYDTITKMATELKGDVNTIFRKKKHPIDDEFRSSRDL